MGGCLISLGIRKLEDEGYREAVDDEILTRCRLKVCREEGDREAVEKRLGFGQVEELIEEALENLNLIYMMLEWEPWHVPEDYEYEVIKVNTVSQTCLLTLTLLTPNGVLQDGRGSLSIKGLKFKPLAQSSQVMFVSRALII
ncbi:probable NADH dehydrogenase [ubiquinone] 1 alpha subcomplex subunit 5, mitochondrial isoform X2 [Musa acuminata AAA Group]|uniref:probable NADH dehydrogenase [ubiquinone] 1 alpha subcomplex subunit 5, mitochondrial isoform X2 n=1 Tax=Musa acuminata AAA Group TaxID=214697 RepID=UPI0031D33B33